MVQVVLEVRRRFLRFCPPVAVALEILIARADEEETVAPVVEVVGVVHLRAIRSLRTEGMAPMAAAVALATHHNPAPVMAEMGVPTAVEAELPGLQVGEMEVQAALMVEAEEHEAVHLE